MPEIVGFDHLVLTVADPDATEAFYVDVLGMVAERFRPAQGPERRALRFGAHKINLHDAAAPFVPHAKRPVAGAADVCLLTEAPLEDWLAHLEAKGVAVEGPVPRTGARGAIMSLYVRDPDGNLVEIARYP